MPKIIPTIAIPAKEIYFTMFVTFTVTQTAASLFAFARFPAFFLHLHIIYTKPQEKMRAFSFEAQTQRVKDVCLHIFLSSFFLSPFYLRFLFKLLW